jgi:hypothetical protein
VFSVRYGLQDTKTLHSVHTVYLCVPYGSHSKQRWLPTQGLGFESVKSLGFEAGPVKRPEFETRPSKNRKK